MSLGYHVNIHGWKFISVYATRRKQFLAAKNNNDNNNQSSTSGSCRLSAPLTVSTVCEDVFVYSLFLFRGVRAVGFFECWLLDAPFAVIWSKGRWLWCLVCGRRSVFFICVISSVCYLGIRYGSRSVDGS